MILFNGMIKTASQWDAHMGWPIGTVKNRIHKGWSIERALTTEPVKDLAAKGRMGAKVSPWKLGYKRI